MNDENNKNDDQNKNEYDFREVNEDGSKRSDLMPKEEKPEEEKENTGKTKEEQSIEKSDNEDAYEDVCFICRRPESKAGKMYKLPNNICICEDCMHKTMDTVSQFDYQNMLNNPQLMNELNKKNSFPNISFLNLNDFQNNGGIPNSQKIKKKKEKNKRKN